MKNKLRIGRYQHYKGGEYEVLGVARHTETHEELVVYRALYESETSSKSKLWVRPLAMFMEMVTINGKRVPRFEYVE